ncbi:MAG: short-chain fatty acyl-CoA regulator family protein [Polyangiaceae bacterium]
MSASGPTNTSAPVLNSAVGRRLRELRLEQGHSQAEFARRLGISPAYLNLIEKGKRTVQLPLLWKALGLLHVEPEPFIGSLGAQRVEDGLAQLLDEPLLRSLNLDADELASLSAEPRAVTTITTLFNLYKNTRSQLDNLLYQLSQQEADKKARSVSHAETEDGSLRFDYSPLDEVIDFLEANDNFFAEVEEAAARVRSEAELPRRVNSEQLGRALERYGIVVQELTQNAGSVVRRYDPGLGRLEIGGELSESRKKFDLGHVLGLRLLDDLGLYRAAMSNYTAKHQETLKLLKVHLANYFAGALLMPYSDFFAETQAQRYDVERLARSFEVSYEAAAHRITNLGDPQRRGVPMHFLRVDIGGNISKRYSATGLRFPGALGSCPKWVVHTAFLTPSVISKQFSVMPDGTSYFCFAKVTAVAVQGSLARGTVYSIGLGTHAEDAHHLAYADEHPRWARERAHKIGIPVGVTCRFCERPDCNQRAAPSYKFAFNPNELVKKDNFFSPVLDSDSEFKDEAAASSRKLPLFNGS